MFGQGLEFGLKLGICVAWMQMHTQITKFDISSRIRSPIHEQKGPDARWGPWQGDAEWLKSVNCMSAGGGCISCTLFAQKR